ncbi:hypothetical protein SI65_07297 [Aspergillus cristatus]|uniref:Uncharacterized protein n=1 Tax=Aspergillus cristatus TaxID=573508 RepID=A0A1E3B9H9_ASPCR|nr:hypothetical protein SI65_07297 [Aspergillus cristatus]
MSKSVNSPRPRTVIPSLATRQQTIECYLNDLNDMFYRFELAPVVLITVNLLGVREEELKLQDNGLYDEIPSPCFNPIPNIDKYPTNFTPGGVYNHPKAIHTLVEEYRHNPSGRMSSQMLANEMSWGFGSYLRLGTRRDRHNLRSLTKWIPSGGSETNIIFAEQLTDTLYNSRTPDWSPAESYIDTEGRPVMLILRHDIDPPLEKEFLSGEILAILAAIMTRMHVTVSSNRNLLVDYLTKF